MKNDMVHVNVVGNLIKVICHNETQQQRVIENMAFLVTGTSI